MEREEHDLTYEPIEETRAEKVGLLGRHPWLYYPLFTLLSLIFVASLTVIVLSRNLPSPSELEKIEPLQQSCSRSTVLRYEDMILDWDKFARDLSKCIKVRRTVLSRIYKKTRPRNREEIGAHRRSGKTESFRNSLSPRTVKSLNDTFRVILDRYQYPP